MPDACGPVASGATHCLLGLGKGLAELGKTGAVATMVTELRVAATAARDSGDERTAKNRTEIADALDAYGKARAGSGAGRTAAITRLKELQGRGSVADPWIRWWLGELLLEDGQLEDAAVYFESHRRGYLNALADFRLGGIYDRLDEREKARAAYVRFLQAWEEADPGLPQVDQARTALERLLAD
jgi:TolA-binding protein